MPQYYQCPLHQHNSTENDFCSECGAKIMGLGIAELLSNPTNPPPITSATRAVLTQPCPDCSTIHEADTGNFCEICGYNFLTNAKGGDPPSSFPPSVNLSPSINIVPAVVILAQGVARQCQVVISIDPSLASPDSPPAPTQTPITLDLNQGNNLIGRTSQARAIHPEIPIDWDDAVSSRHAILTLHPDGSFVLRDIGSSNGTMVNGKEIAIMADISIGSGDEITLGHWTRIQIK